MAKIGNAVTAMSREGRLRASLYSIKMPDGSTAKDTPTEPNMELDFNYKKRQQLISFGHSQWGFKNWNWSVTKQDLDFIDYSNGKYIAGVVAFVSVTVNSLGLRREDVGYATTVSTQKGGAIYNARKGSITNALRETLLGFGGSIASQLIELLEASKMDSQADKKNVLETAHENNENLNLASNTHIGEPKNTFNASVSQMGFSHRKDSSDSSISVENNQFKGMRSPQRYGGNQQSDKNNLDKSQNQFPIINNARIISQTNLNETPNFPANQAASKPNNGFVANHNPKMVAPITQVPPPPPLSIRPNTGPASLTAPHHPSNVSYLVQHVMPPLYSVQCAAPHTPPPPLYHNTYYTEYPPWPVYDNYDRHNKVNVNFNMPPKNFVMSAQTGMMECQQPCNGPTPSVHSLEGEVSTGSGNFIAHPFNMNGAWIKPTIFYDGFWTEQKVKKWVAEQMDKPTVVEESRTQYSSETQKQMCHSKV